MNDRILSLLGLCRRAGRLVIGAQPCIESINAGKARLLIMASDFSQGSARPVMAAAQKLKVKLCTVDRTKNEISVAVGKLCGVLAIEDEGFAKKLDELINS